jgi:hypothetical protein
LSQDHFTTRTRKSSLLPLASGRMFLT